VQFVSSRGEDVTDIDGLSICAQYLLVQIHQPTVCSLMQLVIIVSFFDPGRSLNFLEDA